MDWTVRYEVTAEDLDAEFDSRLRGAPGVPRRVVGAHGRVEEVRGNGTGRWVVLGTALALTGWFGWRFWEHSAGTTDVGESLVTGAMLPVVLAAWVVVVAAFGMDVPAGRGKGPAAVSPWRAHRCGVWEMTLREDRLVVTGACAEVSVSWELTRRFQDTATHVFVEVIGMETLIIPKRELGEDRAAFVEELRRRAGAGAAALVRRYADAWGSVCPRCGYGLRGIAGVVCPECGVEVDVWDLWRAEVMGRGGGCWVRWGIAPVEGRMRSGEGG